MIARFVAAQTCAAAFANAQWIGNKVPSLFARLTVFQSLRKSSEDKTLAPAPIAGLKRLETAANARVLLFYVALTHTFFERAWFLF